MQRVVVRDSSSRHMVHGRSRSSSECVSCASHDTGGGSGGDDDSSSSSSNGQ